MNFNAEMLAKMREATSLLQTEGPMAATAAIQRALHGIQMPDVKMPDLSTFAQPTHVMRDINPRTEDAAAADAPSASEFLERFRKSFRHNWSTGMPAASDVEEAEIVTEDSQAATKGKFIAGSCSNRAGKRAYKLYIPSSYRGHEGTALPLVVMLHGCKQNPDDFAAGTQMNQLAEENNCLVVYPAQAQNANGSNCWNWFRTEDQLRDQGEPSIIADITREIIRTYHVDSNRVYVAGLSAGGAMAAVMGNTYPELYAAIGMHSGLPHGAAHDMMSAFAAMRNGMPSSGAASKGSSGDKAPIPVIVFHGDRDTTVHPRNSDQALAQCLTNPSPKASRAGQRGKAKASVHKGTVPNGHGYTTVVQYDETGKAIAEQWTIHGAGHAWSGGSRKGSYTDPKGPNATQEMLRFFYTHTKAR